MPLIPVTKADHERRKKQKSTARRAATNAAYKAMESDIKTKTNKSKKDKVNIPKIGSVSERLRAMAHELEQKTAADHAAQEQRHKEARYHGKRAYYGLTRLRNLLLS